MIVNNNINLDDLEILLSNIPELHGKMSRKYHLPALKSSCVTKNFMRKLVTRNSGLLKLRKTGENRLEQYYIGLRTKQSALELYDLIVAANNLRNPPFELGYTAMTLPDKDYLVNTYLFLNPEGLDQVRYNYVVEQQRARVVQEVEEG